jgi:hypothetical protein
VRAAGQDVAVAADQPRDDGHDGPSARRRVAASRWLQRLRQSGVPRRSPCRFKKSRSKHEFQRSHRAWPRLTARPSARIYASRSARRPGQPRRTGARRGTWIYGDAGGHGGDRDYEVARRTSRGDRGLMNRLVDHAATHSVEELTTIETAGPASRERPGRAEVSPPSRQCRTRHATIVLHLGRHVPWWAAHARGIWVSLASGRQTRPPAGGGSGPPSKGRDPTTLRPIRPRVVTCRRLSLNLARRRWRLGGVHMLPR